MSALCAITSVCLYKLKRGGGIESTFPPASHGLNLNWTRYEGNGLFQQNRKMYKNEHRKNQNDKNEKINGSRNYFALRENCLGTEKCYKNAFSNEGLKMEIHSFNRGVPLARSLRGEIRCLVVCKNSVAGLDAFLIQ